MPDCLPSSRKKLSRTHVPDLSGCVPACLDCFGVDAATPPTLTAGEKRERKLFFFVLTALPIVPIFVTCRSDYMYIYLYLSIGT